jgi:predicted nucleic acid-binding protein
VALVSSRDAHHTWALRVAEQVAEPLLTCEPVLAETAFHLGNVELILEMVSEEFVALAFDCNDHLPQLMALAKRYTDRRPDLADLCLIRMSELFPNHSIITVDQDFRVYRRNKREVIPLICPP